MAFTPTVDSKYTQSEIADLVDGLNSRRDFFFGDADNILNPAGAPILSILQKFRKQQANSLDELYFENRKYYLKDRRFYIQAVDTPATDWVFGGTQLSATSVLGSTKVFPAAKVDVEWHSGGGHGGTQIPWLGAACADDNFVLRLTCHTDTSKYANFLLIGNCAVKNELAIGSLLLLTPSPGFTPSAGDYFDIIGSAFREGSGAPNPFRDTLTPCWYSVQTFKNLAKISDDLYNMAKKGVIKGIDEWVRISGDTRMTQNVDIERAIFDGCRVVSADGDPFAYPNAAILNADATDPRRMTAGLRQVIKWADSKGSGGSREFLVSPETYTYSDWVRDTEVLSEYGSPERFACGDASWLTQFNLMALKEQGLRMYPNESVMGIKVTKVVSPHLDINYIKHPLARKGEMFVLDMNNIDLMVWKDQWMKPDVGDPKVAVKEDLYTTQVGLKVKFPETHGVFILG